MSLPVPIGWCTHGASSTRILELSNTGSHLLWTTSSLSTSRSAGIHPSLEARDDFPECAVRPFVGRSDESRAAVNRTAGEVRDDASGRLANRYPCREMNAAFEVAVSDVAGTPAGGDPGDSQRA